jgi:hypothetical protein
MVWFINMPEVGKEPVKTEHTHDPGRPSYTEEQYQKWLDDMASFLKAGNTLWYAMDKCALLQFKDTIYSKYRLKDWFSEKVDAYRASLGEMINNTFFTLTKQITDKVKNEQTATGLTKEELDILKFMAEKHRTSQPFFVTRTETATVDPDKVGKILDNIETDYNYVGSEAKRQMVAINAPIQNKEQTGADSNVSTQLPTAQAPSGTGVAPVQPDSKV